MHSCHKQSCKASSCGSMIALSSKASPQPLKYTHMQSPCTLCHTRQQLMLTC